LASRFHFHGEALAFAGNIRVPFEEIIPVQAPSMLSEMGGYCASVSKDFQYRELVRFDHAHTIVTGSQTGDEYATMIQSTVEGLNINGMLTADRIVARIFSTYRDSPDGEPSIKLIGSRFENLKIAGIPIQVDLATDVLDRYDKHNTAITAFEAKDAGFCPLFEDFAPEDKVEDVIDEVKDAIAGKPAVAFPSNKGFTEISLVRKLTPLAPGFPCPSKVVKIDGFGTIRLATLQLSQYTRRLTMVDITLGCAVMGQVMACEIQDGGVEW
jgi:hypothetical protein